MENNENFDSIASVCLFIAQSQLSIGSQNAGAKFKDYIFIARMRVAQIIV
jgi:hypothetical protein